MIGYRHHMNRYSMFHLKQPSIISYRRNRRSLDASLRFIFHFVIESNECYRLNVDYFPIAVHCLVKKRVLFVKIDQISNIIFVLDKIHQKT